MFFLSLLLQAGKLRQLLLPDSQFEIPKYENVSYDAVPSKVILASAGFKLGDRVLVGESKVCVLTGALPDSSIIFL